MYKKVDVFHPKISFLIEKYKSFIINIYIKIKESFINNSSKPKEVFSVINDIYKLLNNYNAKYQTELNNNKIIHLQTFATGIIPSFKIIFFSIIKVYNHTKSSKIDITLLPYYFKWLNK